MVDKRRFVGPNGAVFVPNVADDTIEFMVAKGEWTPFEEPEKAAKATKNTKK